MVLCRRCALLDFGLLIERACTETDRLKLTPEPFLGGISYVEIRQAAAEGCELCRAFQRCILEEDLPAPSDGVLFNISLHIFECLSERSPVLRQCFSLLIDIDHDGRESLNWFGPWRVLSLESVGSCSPYVVGKRKAWNPSLWRSWVDDCNRYHGLCNASFAAEHVNYTPTRLIDVRPDLGSPRLVECSEIRGEYVALSHCWGGSLPLTTTLNNYSQQLSDILWDSLPLTFRDAISVTRAIGYRYIWIDCLCIIQDSEEDWLQECALMSKIYAGAAVTIAASESGSPTAGLFVSSGRPEQLCSLPVIWPRTQLSDTLLVHLPLRPRYHGPDSITEGPLSTRGWAFQERFLSPRVLHISGSRIYFECISSNNADCLPWPMAHESFHHTHILSRQYVPSLFLKDWYHLIDRYAGLELSKGKDRLPAVSGVVRTIAERLRLTFVAGLWSHDLVVGLLWRTWDPGIPLAVEAARHPGPSWSWASADRTINYHDSKSIGRRRPDGWLKDCHSVEELRAGDWAPSLDIQHWELDFVNEDSYGEVRSGQLTAMGKLWPFVGADNGEPIQDVPIMLGSSRTAGYRPDRSETPFPSDTSREDQCLLVGFTKSFAFKGHALVVRPLPATVATFRRIGFLNFPRGFDEYHDTKEWEDIVDKLLALETQRIYLV